MSLNPLTNEQLKDLAPALFTQTPHFDVSEKYHFIPSIDVIEEVRANNWYPVTVSQANIRNKEKEGYQQHCVRFRHFEDLINPSDNCVELLLFNSHDRSKAFSICAGIYRFVCANGLVISNKVFETFKIKHLGNRDNDVDTAVKNITSIKSTLLEHVKIFESITLNESEKQSFANSCVGLRFEEHLQIDASDLLIPHRAEDMKDDLYTTLNILQENLIRGNIQGFNKDTGRNFTSKAITAISKDVSLNQGLWDMAEKIALIKSPTYQMAA